MCRGVLPAVTVLTYKTMRYYHLLELPVVLVGYLMYLPNLMLTAGLVLYSLHYELRTV